MKYIFSIISCLFLVSSACTQIIPYSYPTYYPTAYPANYSPDYSPPVSEKKYFPLKGILTGVGSVACLVIGGVLNASYKDLKSQAADNVMLSQLAMNNSLTAANTAAQWSYLEGGHYVMWLSTPPSPERDAWEDKWIEAERMVAFYVLEMKRLNTLSSQYQEIANMIYEDAGERKVLFVGFYIMSTALVVNCTIEILRYRKREKGLANKFTPLRFSAEVIPGGGRLAFSRAF